MSDYSDLKAIAEACQHHQPLRFMRSHGALYIRNDNGIVFDVHQNRSFPEFMAQNKDYADLVLAANPESILALIAENERVKARLCVCRDCGGQGEFYSGHSSYQGHNQPPEPDMEVCGTCGGDGVLGPLEDFEAIAAERDQLRAENERLQKLISWQGEGNNKLEVNAGPLMKHMDERDRLRAEVAGLRTGYEAYERVNAELKAECEGLRKDAERYRWLMSSAVWNGTLGIDDGWINFEFKDEAQEQIDAAMGKGDRP